MDNKEVKKTIDKLRTKLLKLNSDSRTSVMPTTSSISHRSLHKRTNTELSQKSEVLPKDISHLQDKKFKLRPATKKDTIELQEILGVPSQCKKLPTSLTELEEFAKSDPPRRLEKNPSGVKSLQKLLKNNKEKYLKQVAIEGGFLYRTQSGQILPQLSGIYEQVSRRGKSSNSEISRFELDLGKPSGRKEVKVIIAWFENMMETFVYEVNDISIEEKVRRTSLINSACFKEVIRQVSNHCIERGALLYRIWNSELDLYSIKQDEKEKAVLKTKKEINSTLTDKEKLWVSKEKKLEGELKELKNLLLAKERNIQTLNEKIEDMKVQFVNDRRKIIKGISSVELGNISKKVDEVSKLYVQAQVPVAMLGFYDLSGIFHKTKLVQEVNGEKISEDNIDQVVTFVDSCEKGVSTEILVSSIALQTNRNLEIQNQFEIFCVGNEKSFVEDKKNHLSKVVEKTELFNLFENNENLKYSKTHFQIKRKKIRMKKFSKSLNSSIHMDKSEVHSFKLEANKKKLKKTGKINKKVNVNVAYESHCHDPEDLSTSKPKSIPETSNPDEKQKLAVKENNKGRISPLLQESQSPTKYKIVKTSIDSPNYSPENGSEYSFSSDSAFPSNSKIKSSNKKFKNSSNKHHINSQTSKLSGLSFTSKPCENSFKIELKKSKTKKSLKTKNFAENEINYETNPNLIKFHSSYKDPSKIVEKILQQDQILAEFKSIQSTKDLETILNTYLKFDYSKTDKDCQTEELLLEPILTQANFNIPTKAYNKKKSIRSNIMKKELQIKELKQRQNSPPFLQAENKMISSDRSRSRKRIKMFVGELSFGGIVKRNFISHPSQNLFSNILGNLNSETGNLKISLKSLLKTISSVYQEKITLCKENSIYYRFETYMVLYDWLIKKYGLKNVAEGHFLQVIKSAVVFKEKSPRVKLFSRLLGTDAESFKLEDWNFFTQLLEITDYHNFNKILAVDEGSSEVLCGFSTSQQVINTVFSGRVPEKSLENLIQKTKSMKIVTEQAGSKRKSTQKFQENINLDDFLQLSLELYVEMKKQIRLHYWPEVDEEHPLTESDYFSLMKSFKIETDQAAKMFEKFCSVQKLSEEKLQKVVKTRSLASLLFENSLFDLKSIFNP